MYVFIYIKHIFTKKKKQKKTHVHTYLFKNVSVMNLMFGYGVII